MKIVLNKKPRNATIIEGFPGLGLVGTIAVEYLLDHLQAEPIGEIRIQESPPMIAVHKGKVIEPLGIFYNKKYNLIILHALTPVKGMEWALADAIHELCEMVGAKEIISLEGVGAPPSIARRPGTYFISNKRGLEKTGIEPLREGIVMGVTGALLLSKKANISAIFAETHSTLPDSRAAAKIIEVLDKYLGLKVDYTPLLKKAQEFESKVKGILSQGKSAVKIRQRKELTYLG